MVKVNNRSTRSHSGIFIVKYSWWFWGGGTLSPQMGVLGAKLPIKTFGLDKSTGLEYFSNDNSITKRH